MDPILLIKAAIMGVVEGLTEFLPVSSTGHLILAAALLNLSGEKIKVFEVVIQTGAIMAIISFYLEKLWSTLVGLPRERVRTHFRGARSALSRIPPMRRCCRPFSPRWSRSRSRTRRL